MKKKSILIVSRIFLFTFVIITIYMTVFGSFVQNEAKAELLHNLDMEWLQCYDSQGNRIGTGFHCTWSGDNCWYYGSWCPAN